MTDTPIKALQKSQSQRLRRIGRSCRFQGDRLINFNLSYLLCLEYIFKFGFLTQANLCGHSLFIILFNGFDLFSSCYQIVL